MNKKICVITGSRAEYGLLRPLLQVISCTKDLNLQIIVMGMHLSSEFGLTYHEIEKDGFVVNEKVEMLLSSDTSVGIAKSMGLAMISLAETFERIKPDMMVLLGDRFEIFSAAAAANVARIKIAHIHGGELTEGAFDDAFRHAISKMSHLHFTSTEEYRRRVIQLGEPSENVFNVGALGIDNIKTLKLLSKNELETELNFKFNKHNLLVTYHPVTLENNTSGDQFQNLLNALDELENTNIIFTKANADTYGRIINVMIDKYVSKNPSRCVGFFSLGPVKYLSVMKYVDAVVGNSSSGIIEAPSFRVATVNIGDRQKGRMKAVSVVDCKPEKEEILNAFRKTRTESFLKILDKVENPYGQGNTAIRIRDIIRNYDITKPPNKIFFDIEIPI